MRRTILAAAAALAVATALSSASAQQQTMRVRGTIEKLDGNTLMVKSREGADLSITLTDNVQVVGVEKAALSDITVGSYIGSAAMPQPDGSQKALEVHIFPETMRGTGEGHRPYAPVPQSTMTNGTVGNAVTAVEGHAVNIKYRDGEKKIVVPPDVPVVRYVIGTKADLKPGAHFTIISATKKPDGTLEAARVNVGRDGVVPQ
ncbi:MAG TPA: hypothetical protein VKB15_03265 [Xanthobacteraceae bacterium]|nr:hypothetical protein [Xanthobacteraceae bacterium]